MKARITKLKNYTFYGEIDGDISEELLKQLDLEPDYSYCLKLEGSINVIWSDGEPYPEVDGAVWAISPANEDKFIEITELVDLDDLNDQLSNLAESQYDTWYADRQGSLIDYAYDSYIDRMMDEAND